MVVDNVNFVSAQVDRACNIKLFSSFVNRKIFGEIATFFMITLCKIIISMFNDRLCVALCRVINFFFIDSLIRNEQIMCKISSYTSMID